MLVEHLVPSDFLVAIVDASSYRGRLGPLFDEDSRLIYARIAEEMGFGRAIAWGTGTSGNWVLKVRDEGPEPAGVRRFVATLTASVGGLHVVNFDSLMAAALGDALPLGDAVWPVPVPPGSYVATVAQAYEPENAERVAFSTTVPHFDILLRPAPTPPERRFQSIPWFDLWP